MSSGYQGYYYEDSTFQLELNLQSVRRQLVSVLEDFEGSCCVTCCNFKCSCPETPDQGTKMVDRDTKRAERGSEKPECIPEASANILHESKELSEDSMLYRLLKDQELYLTSHPSPSIKTSTSHYTPATKNQPYLPMPEGPLYHPQMIYTMAPPARALPQPIWVGMVPQTYAPVIPGIPLPSVPGIPIAPVIPGIPIPGQWPVCENYMSPKVQHPGSMMFKNFQSPHKFGTPKSFGTPGSFGTLGSFGTPGSFGTTGSYGTAGSFGTPGSFKTSWSLERDQVVPCDSDSTDRPSR